MKKLGILCLLLCFLVASKCDNEPLEGEFATEEETSCVFAAENVTNAAIAFSQATDETYEQLCLAYKTAILNLIQLCGDPDGSLQALLDSLGDCIPDSQIDTCAEATAAAAIAQAAFSQATSETYYDLCISYREALLTLIEFCGPDSETLSILNDLGNCLDSANAEGFMRVTAGTLNLEFDIINVFEDGNLLEVTGETGSPTYHIIYFEINLGETGDDIINDSFKFNFTSQYFPSTQGFNGFTSTITTNSPGNIIGTFNGIVTNAQGINLNLTSGEISVLY